MKTKTVARYEQSAHSFRQYLTQAIENDAHELMQDEDVRDSVQPKRNYDTQSTQIGKQAHPFYPSKQKPGPTQRQLLSESQDIDAMLNMALETRTEASTRPFNLSGSAKLKNNEL